MHSSFDVRTVRNATNNERMWELKMQNDVNATVNEKCAYEKSVQMNMREHFIITDKKRWFDGCAFVSPHTNER